LEILTQKMDDMKNEMNENARNMEYKMDGNMQELKEDLKCKMDMNVQVLRGDMQTQRGEMQSMGLNLQARQVAMRTGVRGIMAAPRGGATEPTKGSANCVWPAMETDKVGVTEKLKQVTEKLTESGMQKIKETKGQEVTGTINEVIELTETQRETQDYETKDEHTHR